MIGFLNKYYNREYLNEIVFLMDGSILGFILWWFIQSSNVSYLLV